MSRGSNNLEAKAPDTVMLRNLLRHVDTHNRLVEERLTWDGYARDNRLSLDGYHDR